MPIVKDVQSGQSIEVRGLDTPRALLAVFLREVIYKNRPEQVTAEVVEKHFPEYKRAICRYQESRDDGTKRHFTEFWRFCVEEGLAAAPPRPRKSRRSARGPRTKGSFSARRQR
ncbi:hypothetical protein [Geoalkalibacter halelectricus]|uniref:hypothetical protein n=1 Tax=Geoalkalibacter halelectricus TaxID=2847045 RepID=UPI003D1CD68E